MIKLKNLLEQILEDFSDAAFHGFKMSPDKMRTATCSTVWHKPDDNSGCPQFSDDSTISKEDETKAINYLNSEDIGSLIAYSRGGAVLLQALHKGAKTPGKVYLVAPAWMRQWPSTSLSGSEISGASGVIIHGDSDKSVPVKHSVILAKKSGLPLYVVPGADHISILKNKTNPSAGFQVKDLNAAEQALPDWGESGTASDEQLKQQQDYIAKIKSR